jgi:hypothetical protein
MSVMMMIMFFNPFDLFLASEKMKNNSVNKTIVWILAQEKQRSKKKILILQELAIRFLNNQFSLRIKT